MRSATLRLVGAILGLVSLGLVTLNGCSPTGSGPGGTAATGAAVATAPPPPPSSGGPPPPPPSAFQAEPNSAFQPAPSEAAPAETTPTSLPAAAAAPAATRPKGPVTWGNKADAQANAAGIRVLAPLADREDKLVYAPHPSPMVAAGSVVFDAAAGKEVGSIKRISKASQVKCALSHDGKHFAQVIEDPGRQRVFMIEIVNTETGEPLGALHYTNESNQEVVVLQFTTLNYLAAIVRAQSGSRFCLWKMEDAKMVRDIPLVDRLDADQIALSGNAQYLAAIVNSSQLAVFDVAKQKIVARMESPADSRLRVSSLRSVAFSPDTSEIACLVPGGESGQHLVVWGADGKIVLQHQVGSQIGGNNSEGPGLIWAPDGQGWLLHGDYYFDRQLKAVAWICHPHISQRHPHRFLDNDTLLTTRGDFQEIQLVSVKIPRQDIAAAAASLNSGQPALLKPGDAVALNIQLGPLRYSAAETVTSELTAAITKRLTLGGLIVGPGGNVTLTVKYSEVAGETLRVVEQVGPFGGFGERDTGQNVSETVGRLEAALAPAAGGQPIWETAIERGNPYHIESATVDDAKVRDAMFQGIQYMLTSMTLPYFVPADPQAVRLPITISTAK